MIKILYEIAQNYDSAKTNFIHSPSAMSQTVPLIGLLLSASPHWYTQRRAYIYMLVWNCIKSAFMNIESIQKCKKIILKKLHFRVSNTSFIQTLSLIPVFWLPLNLIFKISCVAGRLGIREDGRKNAVNLCLGFRLYTISSRISPLSSSEVEMFKRKIWRKTQNLKSGEVFQMYSN